MTIYILNAYHSMVNEINKGTYHYAVGRRKLSTAVVKLYPKGQGKFSIRSGEKEVSFKEYFGGHDYMIQDVMYPFTILGKGSEKQFDAEIVVRGGGMMGQTEAIRL